MTDSKKEFTPQEVVPEHSNPEIGHSVNRGVMPDWLNMKLLAASAVGTIGFVLALVIIVTEFFPYYEYQTQVEINNSTIYHEINDLRQSAEKQLNSAGIIDEENRVYHIPIDNAIDLYLGKNDSK